MPERRERRITETNDSGTGTPQKKGDSMSVKRIKNLVKQLNEYRHAYYNQDAPLVSDAEYDRLFDELKELEEQTGFIL